MSAITKNYRVQFYRLDDVSTVEFTVPLATPPNIPTSPILKPVSLVTEGLSASFNVVDHNNLVTEHLGDSDGHLSMIGRRFQLQHSVDGGAWTNIYGGRVSGVSLGANIATYVISVADELHLLRKHTLFEDIGGSTTQLWPPGLRFPWREFRGPYPQKATGRVFDTEDDYKFIEVVSPVPMTTKILENFKSREREEAEVDVLFGNFKAFDDIKVNINGIDFDTFSLRRRPPTFFLDFVPDNWNDDWDLDLLVGQKTITIIVSDPGNDIATGHGSLVYFHIPNGAPTSELPLHVGTFTSQNFLDISVGPHDENNSEWAPLTNPINVLGKIFDDIGLRYNLSNFEAMRDRFWGRQFGTRETSTQPAADWIAENILIPLGIILVQNVHGEVEIREFRVPEVGDSFDVDTVFTFTHSNTRPPYPTWDHNETESISEIIFNTHHFTKVASPSDNSILSNYDKFEELFKDIGDEAGLDLIRVNETETVVRPPDVGLKESQTIENTVEYTIRSFAGSRSDDSGTFFVNRPATEMKRLIAAETMTKFSAGAVRGKIYGMSQAEQAAIRPGDVVKLDLDSYPNPSSNSRGGLRLVQVVNTRMAPEGGEYDFIDLGPAFNPIPAPSISVSASSQNPRNKVAYNITGIPSEATAIVQADIGADGNWFDILVSDPSQRTGTSSTGTFVGLPSGTVIRFRVRAIRAGSLRSDYSTIVTHTTTALSPPTNVEATVIGSSIKINWDSSDEGYAVMPVAAQVPEDPKDAVRYPLGNDTETFIFHGFTEDTEYEVGVKHVDPFGGESAIASDVATAGTPVPLNAVQRVWFRQARANTNAAIPQKAEKYGVEVEFIARELHADIVVQAATNSNFAVNDIISEQTLEAGTTRVFIYAPLTEDPIYVRIRHERPGFVPSNWSPIITAFTTGLISGSGADSFPAGVAYIVTNSEGFLKLFVHHQENPYTERAYWDFHVVREEDEPPDPLYPVVDEDSNFILREDMPYDELLLDEDENPITLDVKDTVYLTVRFWSEDVGFGQTTLVEYFPDIAVIPTLWVEVVDTYYGGVSIGPDGDGSWVPTDPQATYPNTSQAPSYNLRVHIEDRRELGGQLDIWTNPDQRNSASPSSLPDAVLGAEETPVSFGPEDSSALSRIKAFIDQGIKSVYFRWTSEDGRTTGIVVFALGSRNPTTSWQDQVIERVQQALRGGLDSIMGASARALILEEFERDLLGSFAGERILTPQQIRDTDGLTTLMDGEGKKIQNLLIEDTVTDSGDRSISLFLAKPTSADSDDLDSVPNGVSFRKVISVNTNGQVTVNSLATNSVTAIKINVANLSQIADNVGIQVSGVLRNAEGTRFIDLDAGSSTPFIMAAGGIDGSGNPTEGIRIDGDGTTYIAGEIHSSAGGTFAGTLTASTQVAMGTFEVRAGEGDWLARLHTGTGIGGRLQLRSASSGSPTTVNLQHGDGGTLLSSETIMSLRAVEQILLGIPGKDLLRIMNTSAAGQTSLLIVTHEGGSTFKRVFTGAEGSGGSGFRLLRVLN